MEVILTQPVATQRAECLNVRNLWIIDDEALGNRMGAAWIKKDLIRDLT